MTIEEYLNKRIEDLEEGPCNSSVVQGKILAYREIISKLPEFDHDVTLKEVKEFCTERKEESDVDEDPCDYCPMAEKYSCSDGISFMQCGQIADILPCDWDIDAIQKHMKEAQQ